MTEISTTQSLCWIEDKFENRYYKECTKQYLADARLKKMDICVWDSRSIDKDWKDIFVPWSEVLTDYFVARYGEATTIDRFIHFALPKQPKFIQDRFLVAVWNMWREQRKKLTYEALMNTIKSWKHDDEYYDTSKTIK